MRNGYGKVAIVCLFLMLFVVSLAAAEPKMADPVQMLSSFSDSEDGWKASYNVQRVERVDFAAKPAVNEEPVPTRSCLLVQAQKAEVSWIRSAEKKFTEPFSFGEYRAVSFDIFVPAYEADPFAEYLTRLTLVGKSGEPFEYLAEVTPGQWCTVTADISAWAGRETVISADVSLIIGTAHETEVENSFYIDDVRAEDPVDMLLAERFLFDRCETVGGNATFAGDRSMITLIPALGQKMSVKAAIIPPDIDYEANCLRFNLANYTNSEEMTIFYSTSDSTAATEVKSVTLSLEKQSDEQYYYAFVGDVTKLTSIELRFEGSGRAELKSISAISLYQPKEIPSVGKITSCTLGDDLQTVQFNGEISREEALLNAGGDIHIYCLQNSDVPSAAQLAEMQPVVISPMTTVFHLNYSLPAKHASFARDMYLAVSMRKDGSFALIAPPFQIENPARAATCEAGFEPGAKGFVPEDLSLTGELGAGVTQFTLEAQKIFGEKNTSERYLYNGEAYYFDKAFVEHISTQLQALHDTDIAVLVRLEGFDSVGLEEVREKAAADPHKEYTSALSEADGTDYFGAMTDYLGTKWAAEGLIAGVIVGDYANNLREGMRSMEAAVKMAASSLRIAHANIVSKNGAARVYLSVSDTFSCEPCTGNEEMGLLEFIPALLAQIKQNGSFAWSLCIENMWRFEENADANLISAHDCEELLAFLGENGGESVRLLFCDYNFSKPDVKLGSAAAWFVRGYLAAYFNPAVDSYLAISTIEDDTFYEMIQALDTADSEPVLSLALIMLKQDSWSDIIDNFDEKKMQKRKVTLYPATTETPKGILGTFSYYRFDNFMGVGELKPAFHCGALTVGDDKTLRAPLGEKTSGAWMGIVHRFKQPENLNFTPVLEIKLKLDNVKPADTAEAPVKLVLLGEGERFESEAVIPTGEWTTIYVYTGDFGKIYNTESLQLLVDGSALSSATLCLESINGLSREYNDESLESVIAEERLKKQSQTEEKLGTYTPYLWLAGMALVAIATVAVVIVLSRRRKQDLEE